MSYARKFESFLADIKLEEYREQFAHIKLVELDMPREIQALPAIYECYWNNQNNWVTFEDFMKKYREPI